MIFFNHLKKKLNLINKDEYADLRNVNLTKVIDLEKEEHPYFIAEAAKDAENFEKNFNLYQTSRAKCYQSVLELYLN